MDTLIQRGWNPVRVRQVVLIGGTALGLGIFGTTQSVTPFAAVFWISISIGGLSAASPVGWSIPSLIAPRKAMSERWAESLNLAEPNRGHRRSHHHRIYSPRYAFFLMGVWSGGGVSGDWNRGVRFPARPH